MTTNPTLKKAIPVSEAQAQRAVRDLFELYGWEVLKTEEDRFRGIAGLPDLLCTSPHGLQLWIEMKRPASSRNPRGRVRKAQRERLIGWRQRGVPCCVADGAVELLQRVAQDGQRWENMRWVLDVCDRLMANYDWWPERSGHA